MEEFMLQTLTDAARIRGIQAIQGVYIPTPKNPMVSDLYSRLGFTKTSESPGGETRYLFKLGNQPAAALRIHPYQAYGRVNITGGTVMRYVVVFPGYGSQHVGMGQTLAKNFEIARRAFAEADDLLDYPLSQVCFDGPATDLDDIADAQPAILTTSIAAWPV